MLGQHGWRESEPGGLRALGVVSGAWVGLLTQVALGHPLDQGNLLLALYLFVVIVLTALAVERFWTPKLNRIMIYAIAPLLVLIGARFLWMVWS